MTPNATTEKQLIKNLTIGSFASPGRYPDMALREISAGHSKNFTWRHAHLMEAVAPAMLPGIAI